MKKKPKEVIAKGLSLPRDVVFGDFIITLTGNCEAYIENYRGIVSYDENKISIQGNHVVLNICGCDLEVEKYKLVTSIRGNSMENRISIDSPIGMALKGHKIGDRVEVKVNDSYSYFLEIRSIDKTHSEEEEIRGF